MNIYVWNDEWLPGENTVAYYPLKTDTKDYSGNGRDGTNSNVTFSDGIATFNGSNAMVTIAHADWNKISTNMTIQARFRTSSSSGERAIVAKAQYTAASTSNYYYSMGTSGNYVYGGFAPSSGWQTSPSSMSVPSSTTYSLNVWHLLTITNDGTTKTLYLDGTQIQQSSVASTSTSYNVPLTIGSATYRDVNTFFGGNISRVILENKTRTSDEILNYYNSTKSTYGL